MSNPGRLPSLQSLRVFEAVARHGSFLRAAEELCVTATAVSHQVKALEQRLGVTLFRRLARGVVLTPEGEVLAPRLSQAFTTIGEAVRAIERRNDDRALALSVSPSLATKWLMPRLRAFQDHYPKIEIRLTATSNLADLSTSEIDIALRHGSGTYPGCKSELLLNASVLPVCAPSLLSRRPSQPKPVDLARHVLLHDLSSEAAGRLPGWRAWFDAAGVADVDATRGPRFNNSYLAINAAVEEQGIALAVGTLAELDLAMGRLVVPVNLLLSAPTAYYIVVNASAALRPQAQTFLRWLRREAKQSNERLGALVGDCA